MQGLSQLHSHDVSSQKCLQAEVLRELLIEWWNVLIAETEPRRYFFFSLWPTSASWLTHAQMSTSLFQDAQPRRVQINSWWRKELQLWSCVLTSRGRPHFKNIKRNLAVHSTHTHTHTLCVFYSQMWSSTKVAHLHHSAVLSCMSALPPPKVIISFSFSDDGDGGGMWGGASEWFHE